MRSFSAFLITMLFSVFVFAGFQAFDNTGKNLDVFNKIECSTGVTCTKNKDKLKIVTSTTGPLRDLVLASATTITAAQCGSVFYNAGAIEIELPEASTVLGCELTFVTLNAANFDIDPDAADQILVQTDAAGDKIRNATLGNTITLVAVSASQWVVKGILGTWADAN